MNDDQRGWSAIFPIPFWIGSLVTSAMLMLMARWEKGSNFLVESGLLVSKKKEHLFTLPELFHGVGMTPRTLVALAGVILTVGGLCVLVDVIRKGAPSDTDDEIPPPPVSMPMDPNGIPAPDPAAVAAAAGGMGLALPLPPVSLAPPVPGTPPPG